jgi:hypothetical protein
MIISRKLIVERPNYDLEFLSEQNNRDNEKRIYIRGQYIMMNRGNKNRRKYMEDEMVPAVNAYIQEYVEQNRGGGELNHSSNPDVDLSKLADKIIHLERDKSDPDFYIGKSLILSTPSGKILESLVHDGVKFGKSTKCLGQISESTDGFNVVKSPIVLLVDNVFDPSVATAFVNGILENKEYIISDDGRVAEAYQNLEKKLAKYPSKHRDAINEYIRESLEKFLKTI